MILISEKESKTISTRIDAEDAEKLEKIAKKENIHPPDQSKEEIIAEIEDSKNHFK